MNRNRSARTRHETGAAREETDQGTARGVRHAKSAKDTEEPARPHKRIMRVGQADQPDALADAVAEISEARAAWLEMIRALARAAAQRDHDAAIRTAQSDPNETGDRE